MTNCPTCGRPLLSLRARLFEMRQAAGLSLQQLGEQLDPPHAASTVMRIEKGKTELTARQMVQWARICGADPAVLFWQIVADEDQEASQ